MIVNASIAAAANADRIRNGAIVAAIARGVVGEIADIVIGPAVMSAISKTTTGVDMAYCPWISMLHTARPPKQ